MKVPSYMLPVFRLFKEAGRGSDALVRLFDQQKTSSEIPSWMRPVLGLRNSRCPPGQLEQVAYLEGMLAKQADLSDWTARTVGKVLETRGGQWMADRFIDRKLQQKGDPHHTAQVVGHVLSNPQMQRGIASALWFNMSRKGRETAERSRSWMAEHPVITGFSAASIPLLLGLMLARRKEARREPPVTIQLTAPPPAVPAPQIVQARALQPVVGSSEV